MHLSALHTYLTIMSFSPHPVLKHMLSLPRIYICPLTCTTDIFVSYKVTTNTFKKLLSLQTKETGNTKLLSRHPKSIEKRILGIFTSGGCFFRIVIFSAYPVSALADTYRPLWRGIRLPRRFLYERYKCFLNNLSPAEESVLYWHSGVVAGRIMPVVCVRVYVHGGGSVCVHAW